MIPTVIEFFGMFLGIAVWWWTIYSVEKDQFDDRAESFSLKKWLKMWVSKRNDNIGLHILVSCTALFIGVHNLQLLLKDYFNMPEGLDEVGASVVIGLIGSFIGGLLKQAVRWTKQAKSYEELKKEGF